MYILILYILLELDNLTYEQNVFLSIYNDFIKVKSKNLLCVLLAYRI